VGPGFAHEVVHFAEQFVRSIRLGHEAAVVGNVCLSRGFDNAKAVVFKQCGRVQAQKRIVFDYKDCRLLLADKRETRTRRSMFHRRSSGPTVCLVAVFSIYKSAVDNPFGLSASDMLGPDDLRSRGWRRLRLTRP
jgi:hypothetical protein